MEHIIRLYMLQSSIFKFMEQIMNRSFSHLFMLNLVISQSKDI